VLNRKSQREQQKRIGRLATKRSGFTLIEVMVSIALTGALLVLTVSCVRMVQFQLRQQYQYFIAQESLSNLVERSRVLPWDQLSQETLSNLKMPDQVYEELTAVDVQVEVVEVDWQVTSENTVETQEPAVPLQRAKQITWRLSWMNNSEVRREPLQISTWRFESGATP
jgi:prepilin-type N-terminal cleavage/methylation domain-containing protein